MKYSFPWLPIETEIFEGIKTGKLISQGDGYQLITSKTDDRVIFLIRKRASIVSKDEQLNTLKELETKPFSFDGEDYFSTIFTKGTVPIKLEDLVKYSSSFDAPKLLSIGNAISEMTANYSDAVWDTALYFPRDKICLATEFLKKSSTRKSRYALAVRLMVGFVPNAKVSVKTIRKLNPDLAINNIRDFLEVIGFEDDQLHLKLSEAQIENPSKFKLAGRPDLERFCREKIIDYFFRYDDYRTMGINPPNGVLFYGPPGTGKTFTAKALADFLKWPIFEVDIGSIGSPYIHQTSKKLKEVFEDAGENAPSILLLEEIDALAGARDTASHDSKIEEISQLLRLVETASKQGILVLATTNRYHSMDDAIIRKGRFDYIVEVDLPKKEEIINVLEQLLKKKPTSADFSHDWLSDSLAGRPMSDVAWVVNEAGKIAVQSGKKTIDKNCFKKAIHQLK